MTDELVLLGTKGGPAVRQGGAQPTSSLLRLAGKQILIDCGIGVTRAVVEAGTSLLDLDAIFVTHLHSDHVLELGPLIHTAWTTGLDHKLPVYGPPGLEDYWRNFRAAMNFDHAIRLDDEGRPDIAELVQIHTIGEDWRVDMDGISVSVLRVDHPPVTDCFALRFAAACGCVVFSADTCHFPPLGKFSEGADVLVHEAMLTAGVDRLVARTSSATRLREHLLASHTSAEDVGRIASAGMVGHLVLNHLIPADDPAFGEAAWRAEISKTWNGPLTVGRDGLVIKLEGKAR